MEKEREWRKTLPPFVEHDKEIDNLEQYSQQQSTQQAQRYKASKYNPLADVSWEPGHPYVEIIQKDYFDENNTNPKLFC